MKFIGPPLDQGPLPALFYFALSAQDSLHLDPYNRPVILLQESPLRIFSFDLPFHEEGMDPTKAIGLWAEEMAKGNDILTTFLDQVEEAFHELKKQDVFTPGKIGVAGLSRGGLIATHLAARIPDIDFILGFAPVTYLTYAREFKSLQESPIVKSLSLINLTENLLHRSLRFYISNRDMRDSTGLCASFIEHLAEVAHSQRVRSPQVELIITPPIGHKGHGTSKATFLDGATWMGKKLGVL